MALTQISTKGIKDGTITNADLNASAAIARTKLANVDVVDDTSPQLGGDLQSNGNHILMADTDQIRLGALPDVRFYHDGNHSYLTNATGHFRLRSDSLKIEDQTNGHSMITAVADGAVELYYDNSKKFETISSGVSTDGLMNFNGTGDKILIGDNGKAVFGGGLDLQIYHDGSNSRLKNTTGSLWLQSDNGIRFVDADVNESMAAFYDNGAVELYYDGSKKFETLSGGVQITGGMNVSGNASFGDNNKVKLGTGDDLQIYHNGTHSVISNDTGTLFTLADNLSFKNNANSETLMTATANGAVELYHDNSKKAETVSGGFTVTGTCTATSFAGDGSSLTGITSQGKNLIINGGMRIHQRGTASYTINSGNTNEFIVDRFKVNGGDGTIVASQDTTVPDGQGFSKSIKLDCTVAESSPGSAGEGFIQYIPEGQDFYHLAYGTSGAKAITASFWVKSSLAATYGFYYYIANAGPRAYQTTFTISSANTWEKKTITIPGDTAGNGFNNDASAGAEIRIYFYGGSNFQGSSNQNSWGTNASNRIPSGTNLVSSTSNDFFFTGFQIEVGSQATDYDFCSYAKELSYCQRYYWKIATNTYRRVNGYKRHDANSFWEVKCPVPMRNAPSPTLLTSGTFTNFQSNFNTTQSSPVVNEWNTDTGMGLLHVQSTWGDTHKTIPSWEGYSIEFSAEI